MSLSTTTLEAPATAGALEALPFACGIRPHRPATFGLTTAELHAEIRRCHDVHGWQLWELRIRFAHPATLQESAA